LKRLPIHANVRGKAGRADTMTIPKRPLGRTGYEATIMGLGGEGVLRT
jgi:hypothetical protein